MPSRSASAASMPSRSSACTVSSQDLPPETKPIFAPGLAPDPPVDAVGAGEGLGREALVVDASALPAPPACRPAGCSARPRASAKSGGIDDPQPMRVAIDHRGDLDRCPSRILSPTQTAGIARRAPSRRGRSRAPPARPAGRQDRHHRVDQRRTRTDAASVEHLAGVVVAHARRRTPPRREVPAMLAWRNTSPQRSTPGPLPYQSAEDAVDAALAAQFGLLGAPERGGGEILVQARLEPDVGGRRAALARPRHLQVDAAERRAAIAGDIAGGVRAPPPRRAPSASASAAPAPGCRRAAPALATDRSDRPARRRAASCHLRAAAWLAREYRSERGQQSKFACNASQQGRKCQRMANSRSMRIAARMRRNLWYRRASDT